MVLGDSYEQLDYDIVKVKSAITVPRGSRHRLAKPYEALKTRAGYIPTGANNKNLWAEFCKALGAPELRDDPRFDLQLIA